ncbi:uncharacterized protein [Erythrolamprus reginae]|uniref:uncharacterized protein isoform X3 n=1 Tax=Erythrolamprus reginae TaxID=121349 RepID=UPI00396CE91B
MLRDVKNSRWQLQHNTTPEKQIHRNIVVSRKKIQGHTMIRRKKRIQGHTMIRRKKRVHLQCKGHHASETNYYYVSKATVAQHLALSCSSVCFCTPFGISVYILNS